MLSFESVSLNFSLEMLNYFSKKKKGVEKVARRDTTSCVMEISLWKDYSE